MKIEKLRSCHFDIVEGCQLLCVGCPISTLRPPVRTISPEDFARCLDNIDVRSIGLLRLFNYGEPLLHPDLPAIVEAIPGRSWRAEQIEISTNAQFARWDQLEEVIRMKVLNRLVVSCDGDGTPESYETLRPPSQWTQLIEFLERTSALRNRHDRGLELCTCTIVTSEADKLRWVAFLRPFGFRAVFRGWLNLPQAKRMSGQARPVGQGICPFQQTPDTLYVDVEGKVVPCCAHPRAATLGNLMEQRAGDILNGRGRRQHLHDLVHRRHTMSVCGVCEF